jgi:hypothetical protein
MNKIITSTLIIISTLLFGCTGSPETIHVNLPSRSEWKNQKETPIKGEFKQTKSIALTWTNPKDDEPPKHVQIASSWGVTNFELKPDQTKLVVKKSMFPKDPKVKTPFIFWFSPTFANEVEINGSSFSADEVYFVGQYKMKN